MTTLPAAGRRHRPHQRGRGSRRLLWLPLAAFAAPALVAFVYIGYVLWPRWPGTPVGADAPPLPIIVGGVAFNLPPAAIRVPVQRRPGVQERVDLAFLWPSLAPPDLGAKPPPPTPGAATTATPASERVFVTVSTAGDTLPPAARAHEIYPRYTAAAAVAGPDGLAVLAFRNGTPYEGEDLIYDPAGPSFLARCTRNGSKSTRGICLYERRIEGADLLVRFPRDWLADWRMVASNIDRLIASLRLH